MLPPRLRCSSTGITPYCMLVYHKKLQGSQKTFFLNVNFVGLVIPNRDNLTKMDI